MPAIHISEDFFKILKDEKIRRIRKNPENADQISYGKIAEEMARKKDGLPAAATV